MKKKGHGHVNHERYLVTYSDLITLLLAFFIILYAMSSPDEAKMEALADQLTVAFHPKVDSVMPPLESNKNIGERKHREAATEQERKTMSSTAEQNSLREVKEKIDNEAKKNGLESKVKTKLSDEGLKIILTDEILFSTGSAVLNNPDSKHLIGSIGFILSSIENPVSIEGHTDNVPINNGIFPSNWELSAARSLAVLREMSSFTPSLDPTRFSATGYGEFKPISDNDTEIGKNINRRVEILVNRQNEDGLLKPGGESTN